jgi:uncharacterized protein (TIGR04255 family)
MRYPLVESLATGVPGDFRESIRETYPIHEEQAEFALAIGPTGPAPPQQAVRQRFLTRDRTSSLTVGRDALILETTDYPGWERLRETFANQLEALARSVRIDGVTRLGLRYIDEIRVPNAISSAADWDGWIDERLVAALMLEERPPTLGTIALQYGDGPGYVTAFRAGPLPNGRTVQSEGPLRMPFETPDGPYFLLDTDASWTDPGRQVPEFDLPTVVGILNELHEPSIRLFESAITDRLREEVLNRPREEVWTS